MGNDIAKLFGIEKEEKGLISTLLIQSVFLGVFYGVFNITAHAIFLARFDEMVMARAYIVSGLIGSGLTYLYTVFQSRLKFSIFSVINLSFILLLTLGLWILIRMSPEDWVIFIIFVMLGPLFILTMLGFWGTAGRIFSLRQGRRLFGIIDTGLIVGIIVSSFSIPALLSMNVATHNILLISALSIFIAIFVQLYIGNKYRSKLGVISKQEKGESSFSVFRKDKYVRSMGFFIALSVLVVFFVQYSFMAVTKVRYPEEHDMARFLGFFEGSMMVFTLLIKTFIFSYLIKNQGLKITLAVSPVLIGIFTILVVIIGTTKGFMPGTSGFMIFFLVLALSRLFSKAMKDTVEIPAFKVLYQTLGEKVRHRVQSAIDGTVNEIAALVSGLLLTGLGALTFVKLIHFSWVLIIVIVLWFVYAIRLYNDYRASIRKSLESSVEKDDDGLSGVYNKYESVTSSGFSLINEYYELLTDPDIADKLIQNKRFAEVVLGRAENELNPDLLNLLRVFEQNCKQDSELKLRATSIIRLIENKLKEEGFDASTDLTNTIENSKNKQTQLGAIMTGQKAPLITDLLRLLRDVDHEVQRETIYIIGGFAIKDLLPEVCDCLDSEEVSKDAFLVIRSFGKDAFPALSGHFFRSSGNIRVRRLLIRLFGEIGGKEAIDFLLPRMWSVHRSLRKEAIKGLIKCDYHASEDTRDRLHQEVMDIIGLLTWNLTAKITLESNKDEELNKVIEKETQWWSDFLFDILSLIYDKSSLNKIEENLNSGTVESINFALEMIDIVVDDEVKPRLTALLDVVPLEEKVKNLFIFYPGSIPDYQQLVEDLINKDYNHIGVWVKVCAIRSLYKIQRPENSDFLVALLFSKNKILREEAIRYLRENYESIYESCSYRIPEGFRIHLDSILKGEISMEDEVLMKVESLAAFLPEIPKSIIIDLAKDVMLINDIEENGFPGKGNYIVWPVSYKAEQAADKIYMNWKDTGSHFDIATINTSASQYYKLDIEAMARLIFFEPDFSEYLTKQIEHNLI